MSHPLITGFGLFHQNTNLEWGQSAGEVTAKIFVFLNKEKDGKSSPSLSNVKMCRSVKLLT